MAVTAKVYPQIQQKLATKAVNLSTDSLKVILFQTYTFSAGHSTMSDVMAAGTEATGSGYTTGGQALSGVSLTTSGQVTTLTCGSPTWPSSTITAAAAVFYDAAGGSNATNFPLVHWDLGGSQSSLGAAFTLTISGSGLLTLTAS